MIALLILIAFIAVLWLYVAIENWWTYSKEGHKVLKLNILFGLLAFVVIADKAGL